LRRKMRSTFGAVTVRELASFIGTKRKQLTPLPNILFSITYSVRRTA